LNGPSSIFLIEYNQGKKNKMSRVLLRSVLELRAPLPRLTPTVCLATRSISSTPTFLSTTTTSPTSPDAAASPAAAPKLRYPPEQPIQKPLSDSVRSLLPVLAAQPAHYITIHIHGVPYLVTRGDHVRLPFRMPGVVPGDVLRLTRASVLGSRDLTLRGTPYVDERLFECKATVLGVEAEPMREKVKTKRRNRKTKTVKSKHKYTILGISDLKIHTPEEIGE